MQNIAYSFASASRRGFCSGSGKIEVCWTGWAAPLDGSHIILNNTSAMTNTKPAKIKTITNLIAHDERKRVAALLLFAALIRLIYLYLYSQSPIWNDIIVDSLYHLNWADSIAAGDLLGQQTYFRAPLYIYVLAFYRALTPDSILLPRLLGSALGVVSIFVTYLIVRRSVSGGQSQNIALIAGAFQALYPSLIFFEAELLVDFLFAFLLQITIYRLLIASDKQTTGAYAIAGIGLGLACLTRPTALALIPFFAFFAYCHYSRNSAKTSQRSIGGALALIIATALIIAPVTIRNYTVGDDFTLIATSGGVNFFIGNNSESNPISASLPQPYGANWTLADMHGLAERHENRQLTPAQVSQSWTSRALDWIVDNPLQFSVNYMTKLYLATDNRNYSNNRSLTSVFDANPILKYSPLNAAILFFFAIIGVWRLAQQIDTHCNSTSRFSVLLAPLSAGLYLLIIALFFISERFRLPSLVLLFPAVGVGIHALWSSIAGLMRKDSNSSVLKRLSSQIPISALVTAVVFTTISLLPFGRPVDDAKGRTKYLEANLLLNSGELDQAITAFGELLRVNPNYPRGAVNLGVAYFRKSQPDSARHYFLLELKNSPKNPESLMNLASLALTQGDTLGADSLSKLAYELCPYDLPTLRVRVRALSANSKQDQAKLVLDVAEQKFGANLLYWSERANFYLSLTPIETNHAFEALKKGVALDPDKIAPVENSDWAFSRNKNTRLERLKAAAQINFLLGYHYGQIGIFDSAIQYTSDAIRLDSSLSEAYVNLVLGYLSQGEIAAARTVYGIAQKKLTADRADDNLIRLQQIMSNVQ